MFKIFYAQKDAYITDRVISGRRATDGNTGAAGSLDIFTIYGATSSGSVPNVELSRALVKFNISDVTAFMSTYSGSISDPTFRASLVLKDVYGGQTTPSDFHLLVLPLSQSFDEGTGRDVSYYRDLGAANFLTASWANGAASIWHVSGAARTGLLKSPDIDVITSGNLGAGIVALGVSQSFVKGTEDLVANVTTIVSATISGLIPDCGFRVSYTDAEETDHNTRFVKRFGSRTAREPLKRPALLISWDDSVRDDRPTITLDASGTLYLYNHTVDGLKNLVSGSTLSPVTGSNCAILRLETRVSGAIWTGRFNVSQATLGGNPVIGTYIASVAVPSSDPLLTPQLAKSGSITFAEYWVSADEKVGFMTGTLVLSPQQTNVYGSAPKQLIFAPVQMSDKYSTTEVAFIRVFCRDMGAAHTVKKLPSDIPSFIPGSVYYSVRDADSNDVIVPFDEATASTRLSSDYSGLHFNFDMSSLPTGRSYAIDLMVRDGGRRRVYKDVSSRFKVEDAT